MTQMDLFESHGGTVVAFPVSRRIGQIRVLAREFLEVPPLMRDRRWIRAANALRIEMFRAGFRQAEYEAMVKEFKVAIEREMNRLVTIATYRDTDGAA